MQLNVNDFKPGITFEYEGEIFAVLAAQHSKQARSSAIVKTKIKNLRSGAITVKTFGGGEKVTKAHIDKQIMTFLYQDDELVFLLNELNYEQVEVPKEKMKWELNFLKENSKLQLRTFKGEVLGVELPSSVELRVIEAPEAVRGNTSQTPTKTVKVETGYELEAPIFVNEGDIITIDTIEGKYVSRQNKNTRF